MLTENILSLDKTNSLLLQYFHIINDALLFTEPDSIYDSPDTRQHCESHYDGPSVKRGMTNEVFTMSDAVSTEPGEYPLDTHLFKSFSFVCRLMRLMFNLKESYP